MYQGCARLPAPCGTFSPPWSRSPLNTSAAVIWMVGERARVSGSHVPAAPKSFIQSMRLPQRLPRVTPASDFGVVKVAAGRPAPSLLDDAAK